MCFWLGDFLVMVVVHALVLVWEFLCSLLVEGLGVGSIGCLGFDFELGVRGAAIRLLRVKFGDDRGVP